MKFFGQVGFVSQEETAPGIWEPKVEEHDAYGDVLNNVRRWENSTETVNDSVTTSNRLSILADRFLCEHMGAMRYVKWNGTTWKINSVELIRPRAILSLGGVYNGETTVTSEPEIPDIPDIPNPPITPDDPESPDEPEEDDGPVNLFLRV